MNIDLNNLILLIIFILSPFFTNGQNNCLKKCYTRLKFVHEEQSAILSTQKLWEVDNIGLYRTPLVLDVINNDLIPEIIVSKGNNIQVSPINSDGIVIINTQTKSIEKMIATAFYRSSGIGTFIVGDIDNDCQKEIIVAASETILNSEEVRSRLVCYDLDGNTKWISDDNYGKNLTILEQDGLGGGLGLADFNQDGIAEVYIYNEIFNATNGKKLCDGGTNGAGKSFTSGSGGTQSVCVAANFDNDSELELAAGFTIYDVNITNPNGTTGNSMTPHNIDIGRLADGFTSVADLNEDGILDVVVSGGGYNNIFTGRNIDLYGYTLKNNATELFFTTNDDPFSFYGPIMIDKNASTKDMEFYVMRSGKNLFDSLKNYIYKPELNLKSNWHLLLKDNSNGTVPTLFDLDGDGIKEMIHRDEVSLKIFSLKTNNPVLLYSYPCISGTSAEMSIVADIDGTGEAKICVTCAQNINDRNGKLTIFGPPPGQHWAPARNIWHQYAYNPLFINDDGTVPQYMHNPATYKNGKYNNFMVQESLIDEDGNYPVAAASLTGQVACIDYDVTTQQYTATFSVNNRSDASAIALSGLPISFYNGHPESGGALIGTYRTGADITAGATLSPLTYTFSANDLTSLYMVVNTDKSSIVLSDTSYYDIDECDYTDNIFIAPAPKIINRSQEICQGDSYDFYGTVLTASGQYAHEISNTQACDSIVAIINLAVTNTKMSQQNISTCERYTWNGSTYTQSGQYTYQTNSINGCDSIVTLDLTIHPKQNTSFAQSACDTYTYQSTTYDKSGQYIFQAQTIYGCDSIITLDLTIHPTYDIKSTIAACESYTWQGTAYELSGIYTFSTKTAAGCDSILTLDLTVSPVLETSQNQAECEQYTWNGSTYTQSGQYTYQTTSINGCDSIVTLYLTIHPKQNTSLAQSACDTYSLQGTTYDQSGQYTFDSQTIFGCDSIITLDLTIHPTYDIKSTIAACESYTWQGTAYDQSGVYTYSTKTAAGCDSILTLDLTVTKVLETSQNQAECDQYSWNGSTYTQSGQYTYQTNSINGCDSIVTLDLTIHPKQNTSFAQSACDTYTWQGTTYDQSGQYDYKTQTIYGCDSIITLDLTIYPTYDIKSTIAACDSHTWQGTTYDQSGIYTFSTKTAAGCDSLLTLDLTISHKTSSNDEHEACTVYVWNGQEYTSSGTYSYLTKNKAGCDSLATLTLDIYPSFHRGDTIISDQDYTWPIDGKTYTQSGQYIASFSTEAGCDSIYTLLLRIAKETNLWFPTIFNPTGAQNNVFYGSSNRTGLVLTHFRIYDRWGSLVFDKSRARLNEPSDGWDGRFQNQYCVPGVYVWVAELVRDDGSSETRYGDVTIVR